MILNVATVVRSTVANVLHLAGEHVVENSLLVSHLSRELKSVAIDSRCVEPGALFVALKGENADGHDFVGDAFAAGARACLVSRHAERARLENQLKRAASQTEEPLLLVVDNPLTALQELAAEWRLGHAATVIGITGSVGKTTTKEIIATVLGSRLEVLKNERNLNTEIGLPLTLLNLLPKHEVAVLEMGMYAAGDIGLLAHIARPEIGIVTNVAPVHLERMGKIERIARAKSELIASLLSNGLAILNGDDPWTRAMAVSSGTAHPVLVGFASDCDFRATDIVSRGLEGICFVVEAEGQSIQIRSRAAGRHLIHALLAACVCGRHLSMTWTEIQEAIERLTAEVRQKVIRVERDFLVIDDTYNASPPSVHAALDVLADVPGTKVAVLGDMLELGPDEEDAHREIGEHAASVADWIVVRGKRAGWIAEEAIARGLASDHVTRAESNDEAVRAIHSIVAKAEPNEIGPIRTVLVKGSRGMRMEEIVAALTAEGT